MNACFSILLAIFFVIAGAMHFFNPDFYLAMMPPYLPFHEFLVYFSGMVEIALGLLVFSKKYNHFAGLGMIALLIAVFPANIYMALNPQLFPDVSSTALWLRLPFQGLFIAWVYFTLIRQPKRTAQTSVA